MNNIIYSLIKMTSLDLNQPKNKEYIQKIQSEIDSLEKQLFSKNHIKNENNLKKNRALVLNKDLSVPIETTFSNINEDTIITQQTILNSNMTSNEKGELYRIIMRERKENEELEKLRIEQNEKIKELQNKNKILEIDNKKLKNEIENLRKEKEIQQMKIYELQKENQKLKDIKK